MMTGGVVATTAVLKEIEEFIGVEPGVLIRLRDRSQPALFKNGGPS